MRRQEYSNEPFSSDLYGIACEDLEEAGSLWEKTRTAIEKALHIQLQLAPKNEQIYSGELTGAETLLLELNYDPVRQRFANENFIEYGVLLRVGVPTERADELQRQPLQKVPSLVFLRRREFD